MIWATLAAQLAEIGLEKLGKELEKSKGGKVALDVAQSLGVSATPAAISKSLEFDPAAQGILQGYEMDLLEFNEKAVLSRIDAHKTSKMPAVVFGVLALMVSMFGFAVFFMGGEFTDQQWDFVKVFGPLLVGFFGGAVGYYVTTTASSQQKTDLIARK